MARLKNTEKERKARKGLVIEGTTVGKRAQKNSPKTGYSNIDCMGHLYTQILFTGSEVQM